MIAMGLPKKPTINKWKRKEKLALYREKKYGEESEERKREALEYAANKMARNMTAPERKMVNFLKELKLDNEPQKIVGESIFDFGLNDVKILIEVDGDYFHSNPEIYEESDLNNMQLKNQKRDVLKNNVASGFGYKLLRFWEKDINEDPDSVKKAIKKTVDELKK